MTASESDKVCNQSMNTLAGLNFVSDQLCRRLSTQENRAACMEYLFGNSASNVA